MQPKHNSENQHHYKSTTITHDDDHQWAIIHCECDLLDDDDKLMLETIKRIRTSYGEDSIVQDAKVLMAEELMGGTFNLEHLTAAVRIGMPDPEAEGKKPPQLTNYRSQTAEMLAKGALAHAFNFRFPVAAQEASTNPNQPILGFDGWGIYEETNSSYILVLLQVKATDQDKRPPKEAFKLVEECKSVPKDQSKIARTLTTMVKLLQGEENIPLKKALLKMLEGLGKRQLPSMYVSPAIIRGHVNADLADLCPIRDARLDYAPAIGRGVSMSIGSKLEEFGRAATERARRL